MAQLDFELIGEITDVETMAVSAAGAVNSCLRRRYGAGRWRKMKGKATVQLMSGWIRRAEIHWYEAHGIGRRDLKGKRYLDEPSP